MGPEISTLVILGGPGNSTFVDYGSQETLPKVIVGPVNSTLDDGGSLGT